MNDIADLEGRISAAMARIGRAVEGFQPAGGTSAEDLDLARGAAEAAQAEARAALARAESAEAELDRLNQALETDAAAGDQLRERIDALTETNERQQERIAELETELQVVLGKQAADREELDGLIAALGPLVEEQTNA
jgi:chromosome segregation ATPase